VAVLVLIHHLVPEAARLRLTPVSIYTVLSWLTVSAILNDIQRAKQIWPTFEKETVETMQRRVFIEHQNPFAYESVRSQLV
jgi:hypothetical protein